MAGLNDYNRIYSRVSPEAARDCRQASQLDAGEAGSFTGAGLFSMAYPLSGGGIGPQGEMATLTVFEGCPVSKNKEKRPSL